MAGTRDRLVAATNEMFRRRGYNGTGLKEVTAAARATTGSLYHFFPGGKSELAATVVSETGAVYEQLFAAVADDATGPADGIRDFFEGAAATLEETDYIDVCPIGTVAREVANTDETVRTASDAVFSSWIEALSSRLVHAGLDRPEARILAITVIAALEGGFLLTRTARNADILRTIGAQMHSEVSRALATADESTRAG
jgi:AcrR family transcriptional regulator